MPRNSLEQRLASLEHQVATLKGEVEQLRQPKDWRSTVGMFADDPGMMEIFEAGRKIREKERERARKAERPKRRPVKK